VSLALEAETVKLLTEITLALLLFADASTLKLEQVREDAGLPARLLTAGLLLTILRGASVALMLTPGEGLAFALLLGAILAPTDAALGLPIFNNRRAPVRIRRALNIESGLNDGIANTAGGLVCPSARRGPASTRRAGRYVGTAPAPQVTHKLSNQAMNIQSAGFRANPKTERDASW
jgi:Kef-type K+ transport system membrane component KefB